MIVLLFAFKAVLSRTGDCNRIEQIQFLNDTIYYLFSLDDYSTVNTSYYTDMSVDLTVQVMFTLLLRWSGSQIPTAVLAH